MIIKDVELKWKKREIKGLSDKKIIDSKIAYNILKKDLENSVIEKFVALHIDGRNKAKYYQTVSIGGIQQCSPLMAEIVRMSLITGSVAMIVAHNHPNGNTEPSEEDKKFTEELKDICGKLKIKLLDHIIVSDEGYFSFSDKGLL